MTNQRFTYRKGHNALTVDVYLKATDTFLGSLSRGRGTYHLTDAEGQYRGESAISRDTAAGCLYGYACDAERARLSAPAEEVEAPAEPRAPITVADNHGHSYTARILLPGDTYGNGAVWGSVFYQESRIGITIDGTPATYNADAIAARTGKRLTIDLGTDWTLTEESTTAIVQLARQAMTLAGLS